MFASTNKSYSGGEGGLISIPFLLLINYFFVRDKSKTAKNKLLFTLDNMIIIKRQA